MPEGCCVVWMWYVVWPVVSSVGSFSDCRAYTSILHSNALLVSSSAGYLLILHRIICKFSCRTKKEQKLRLRQWKNCTRIEFMFLFLMLTYIIRFLPHIQANSFSNWVLFVFQDDVVFVSKPHSLFSARKLFSKSNVGLNNDWNPKQLCLWEPSTLALAIFNIPNMRIPIQNMIIPCFVSGFSYDNHPFPKTV